jgi:hypothetical protein
MVAETTRKLLDWSYDFLFVFCRLKVVVESNKNKWTSPDKEVFSVRLKGLGQESQ